MRSRKEFMMDIRRKGTTILAAAGFLALLAGVGFSGTTGEKSPAAAGRAAQAPAMGGMTRHGMMGSAMMGSAMMGSAMMGSAMMPGTAAGGNSPVGGGPEASSKVPAARPAPTNHASAPGCASAKSAP
jgi:hypothetical protein